MSSSPSPFAPGSQVRAALRAVSGVSIVALLAAFLLSSPTLSSAQTVTPAGLLGRWAKEGQKAPYLQFQADSTFRLMAHPGGRWSLAGDTLRLSHENNGLTEHLIKLSGRQLRISLGTDTTRTRWLVFVRPGNIDTTWALDQPLTGRALPCTQGTIKYFECRNVELLAYLPPSAIGGAGRYDLWGWTDSTTGREFALVGGHDGTAFVEVTNPLHPRYLGKLPFHDNVQGTAGVKVYKNHAFIVVEGAPAGLQVFDLTQLRDVQTGPAEFHETAHYGGFANAHTLTLNPETGFAYPTGLGGGGETCNGALYMLDVRTPTQPTFAGCYSDPGYIHDAQCVRYHGPDKPYRGREICLASGIPLHAVDIVDVTDKPHPKRISKAEVPNAQIVHQGWLTDDQRYFFLDDEGDPAPGGQTRTIVFDLTDLDEPVLLTEFFNPQSTATAHNLYIRGPYMYQSNYTAGLRIVDIRDPKHPHEVGFLDTDPYQEGPGQLLGSWGNYPYFKHHVVAVASNGLFLVRFRRQP